MAYNLKLTAHLLKYRWVIPMVVFAAAFFYVGWFWPTLTFPDPDSFYHIKMTELLALDLPRAFPWLPFTVLADNYIDHHLLYHVFLLPFVQLFGSFVGAKIATLVLAAGAVTTFYLVLRQLQFRAPLFFTAVLLTAPGFLLRLSLVKAPAFSIILALLGLLFLVKRRSVALAILSFIYVWAYDLWPILTAMALIWMFSRSFLLVFLQAANRKLWFFWKALCLPEHTRPFLGVLIGTLAGIIINPYFPKNLVFYWHHIVQIGIINYASKIDVGAEWYPMDFSQLLGDNAIVLLVFGLAVLFFIFEARRRTRFGGSPELEALLRTFGLFVLAAVFFVLTCRSRRNIDYFVPFAVVASVSLTTLAWPSISAAYQNAKNWFSKGFRVLLIIPLTLFLAFVAAPPIHSTLVHRAVLMNGESPHEVSGLMTWLRTHAPAGSVVFHDEWFMFPMFFYHDDRLRYITGLDSTFLYARDHEAYELWRAASEGEYAGDVVGAIKKTFGARYILLTGDPGLFRRQLELSRDVHLVYEDGEGKIFEIVEAQPN